LAESIARMQHRLTCLVMQNGMPAILNTSGRRAGSHGAWELVDRPSVPLCWHATQCKSNSVSVCNLPETGILEICAGDYRAFRSENGRNRSLETPRQICKGLRRHGHFLLGPHRLVGNRRLSPIREIFTNPFPGKPISSSKRSVFENRTKLAESRGLERNRPLGE
jgi:hypothetical protein